MNIVSLQMKSRQRRSELTFHFIFLVQGIAAPTKRCYQCQISIPSAGRDVLKRCLQGEEVVSDVHGGSERVLVIGRGGVGSRGCRYSGKASCLYVPLLFEMGVLGS